MGFPSVEACFVSMESASHSEQHLWVGKKNQHSIFGFDYLQKELVMLCSVYKGMRTMKGLYRKSSETCGISIFNGDLHVGKLTQNVL